jgi:hypothetical protein
MACAPFLQRLGWERVRPQQNFSLNIDLLQIRHIPVEYPVQATELALGYRTDEPLHGIAALQPYAEREILMNSNLPNRKNE